MAIVGAGITVHEALKAAETLAQEGIEARVIDLYSIKPLDAETLRSLTCPIVTVEDHWAEGGLGEAVLSCSRGLGRASAGCPARGARDAALRQAGGAARGGRHRRRRHRGRGAQPGAGSRRRVVELVVQPLLLLARGAIGVGAFGARFDDLGDRCVRDLVSEALERENRRAAE